MISPESAKLALIILELVKLALIIFMTYRLTHMVVAENGPFDIFLWLRAKVDHIPDRWNLTWIKEGFNCVLCFSFWLSFLLALLLPWSDWRDYLINALGIAGAVMVIHLFLYRRGD